MSVKDNNTIETKKQYKHLTFKQRCKIETLINLKDENGKRIYSNSEIAKKIGVHKSTITRELKRIKAKINPRTGKIKTLTYSAERAQEDYAFKRGLSKAEYIVERYPKLKEYIEKKIKEEKWSPDVVAGRIELEQLYLQEGFTSISTTTIYRAIHYGLIDVSKDDTRRMNKFKSKEIYSTNKKEVAESKKELSIDLRPENINDRSEYGHWELDTVVSTSEGKHKCLMTLTERKTRYEIIIILEGKTKEAVILKFKKMKDYLKTKFIKVIKSLSTDNGTEFSGFAKIIEITGAKIYFCHPYASCEKGTNEHQNGMIRYFIPKGELIENYTASEINKICDWLNNYPRKILGYLTPKECLKKELNNSKLFDSIINMQKAMNA